MAEPGASLPHAASLRAKLEHALATFINPKNNFTNMKSSFEAAVGDDHVWDYMEHDCILSDGVQPLPSLALPSESSDLCNAASR